MNTMLWVALGFFVILIGAVVKVEPFKDVGPNHPDDPLELVGVSVCFILLFVVVVTFSVGLYESLK